MDTVHSTPYTPPRTSHRIASHRPTLLYHLFNAYLIHGMYACMMYYYYYYYIHTCNTDLSHLL